jgi:hypothetical protein
MSAAPQTRAAALRGWMAPLAARPVAAVGIFPCHSGVELARLAVSGVDER